MCPEPLKPVPSYQSVSHDLPPKRNTQVTKAKQYSWAAQQLEVSPDSEDEDTQVGLGKDNFGGSNEDDDKEEDDDENWSQHSINTQDRLEMGMDPDTNEDDDGM